MDALSEVLRAVRLTGAAILNADCGAPWGMAVVSTTPLARGHIPDADNPAVFHLVVSGECWLMVGDAAPLRLRAGDVAVLAQGDAHRIGDKPESETVALASLIRAPIAGELVPMVHGGSGARTHVITGIAAADRRLADPLHAALPPVLRANLRGACAVDGLVDAVGLALSGNEAPRPGGMASLARFAELIFIEAIRRHVESIPPGATGWLAGLADRYVGRALALMHAKPGDDWTVEKLGRHVGLSRSALADRFTHLLGEPPITYLSHWRLRLAAQKLALTHRSVEAIATEAGYESANAFSHAFKRAFGKPPTVWRKKARVRK
ncbi:AraC family transcriptional regulator [Usitatibacter palustris]|uniref:HTH-type transcriptional regulator MtrA n=1 Tax=Usitatibacter palustris TaxID=2732487 RepID=A0A6M4H8C6_9PROT|nr:AraC family transcriptional regulator [Usitatibacter palustris]QJR15840.1 HTH-type transcriptional regulator MtrA [Usitatibacter palustris]